MTAKPYTAQAHTSRERLVGFPRSEPDLSIKGTWETPLERPLIAVSIYPGVMSYEDMEPLVTADGAPVAATSPGTWGQLYAAGRP